MSSDDLSIWFIELQLQELKACLDSGIQSVVRAIEDFMSYPIPLAGHIPNWDVCLICLEYGHPYWMIECVSCEAPAHYWCVDLDATSLEDPELDGWECLFCQKEEEWADGEHSDTGDSFDDKV